MAIKERTRYRVIAVFEPTHESGKVRLGYVSPQTKTIVDHSLMDKKLFEQLFIRQDSHSFVMTVKVEGIEEGLLPKVHFQPVKNGLIPIGNTIAWPMERCEKLFHSI